MQLKEAFDQADTLARLAAAEAKIPTTPQVAKVKSAVAATTNLPLHQQQQQQQQQHPLSTHLELVLLQ